MYAKLYSSTVAGIDGVTVEVEVDISNGLPAFDVVGLPDTAVREARDRVRSALKNSHFQFPLQRITTNLAPADLKKEGTGFDLAIGMGLLMASGQVKEEGMEKDLWLGELALDGTLRPLSGVLPMVMAGEKAGFRRVWLPIENAAEARLVEGVQVCPVRSLGEVVSILLGEKNPPIEVKDREEVVCEEEIIEEDFQDVRGQYHVKRAMEVAAAGMHNLLLIGPPGSGKTMLAKRLPSILPPMSQSEALAVTKVASIAGHLTHKGYLVQQRPFRSPHHTISQVGLIGGGSIPKPGEVSLAHHGILFLDEMPEFSKSALEVLRQPLEDGQVTISRARAVYTYPSQLLLIGSLNPCPCGFFGYEERPCSCTPIQVQRYRAKLSGPLLDRIDIHVDVPRVDFATLRSTTAKESSAEVRRRVCQAHSMQKERFQGTKVLHNAAMPPALLRQYCAIPAEARHLLEGSFEELGLSARAHDRILKLSRTIADLAGAAQIETAHLAEAIQYRSLDRKWWG